MKSLSCPQVLPYLWVKTYLQPHSDFFIYSSLLPTSCFNKNLHLFNLTSLFQRHRSTTSLACPCPVPWAALLFSKSRTPHQPQGHLFLPQWCSKASLWLPTASPASEPGPSAGPYLILALASPHLQGSAQSTGTGYMAALILSRVVGKDMLPVPCLPAPQEAPIASGFLGSHSLVCCPDCTVSIKMLLV